jgi:hypothetical protein
VMSAGAGGAARWQGAFGHGSLRDRHIATDLCWESAWIKLS